MKIILGSQSANRREVLEKAGYQFEIMVPGIDEKAIRHADPYEIPVLLAKAKATALLPKIKEPALLITADQVIVWNGGVYEKAEDEVEARRFLSLFNGSPYPAAHVNGVGVTNTMTGRSQFVREVSNAYFSTIPKSIVDEFFASGAWKGKAGGYDIRHPILAPFIRLEGTMDSALGLPMNVVEQSIKELEIVK